MAIASTSTMAVILNADEKTLCSRVIKCLIFGAGLATCETPENNLPNIRKIMKEKYDALVAETDLYVPETSALYGIVPQRAEAEASIKAALVKAGDPTKLWKTFKEMKSEFMNHWKPHVEDCTGDGAALETMLHRVRVHVWAYRQNKRIKTHNKKATTSSPPSSARFRYVWKKAESIRSCSE